MIDLHTHTNASDGKYPPGELVSRAASAGVTVLAVTDHDTIAGCAAAAAACAAANIGFVPGIEITAVHHEADIHILGYFFDVASPGLLAFLAAQRRQRVERVRRMIDRLGELGMPLDADRILQPAVDDPTKSAGRPWIAAQLVAAGYVASVNEAFDKWLERGKPGFVSRIGAGPAEVIAHIHDAGGLASLAHPVLLRRDAWVADLAGEGLDAIEAYHSKHDAAAVERYLAMAASLHISVSGGSDFHGHNTHGPHAPGMTSLPKAAYDELVLRANARAAGRTAN